MKKSIVILGSINFDVVARADRLPVEGETVNGTSIDFFVGGKGSNQATQASLMGGKSYFIGKVGNDDMGKKVKNSLISKGVDCSYLEISETLPTGCAAITLDPKGRNTLVHAPGANGDINVEFVSKAENIIKNASVFITQNEINAAAVREGMLMAYASGADTILNPAPAIPLNDELFKNITYITPNETESEEYTGILRSDMPFNQWKRKSAEWFLDKGVKNVCITLGEKGAYFYNGKEEHNVPAYSVKPVDTTAAGDAFNGGFAFGIYKQLPILQCLQRNEKTE